MEVTIGLVKSFMNRGADGLTGGDFATDDGDPTDIYENTEEATRTTNADGVVTFVVDAPRDVKSDEDQDFVDTVTFTAADSEDPGDAETEGMGAVNWIEEDPTYTHADASGTTFVTVDGDGNDDDANINASVRLYDQYGNGIRQNAAGDAYYVEMGIVDTNGCR